MKSIESFKKTIWSYYRDHKRAFPWRETRDPYRILVSEIMLQQTQTERVVGKYSLFLRKFPSCKVLAHASPRAVLALWQGLGYNRRALALKKISEIVINRFQSRLPKEQKTLEAFPGIGNATAGAISAFAFNLPAVFIETNIRRVFIHFFFPRRKKVSNEEITMLVKKTIDRKNPREWYWALMDYGAMLGRTVKNPNKKSVNYRVQPKFEGSQRKLRGMLLSLLLQKKRGVSIDVLCVSLSPYSRSKIAQVLASLLKEGFVAKSGNKWGAVS